MTFNTEYGKIRVTKKAGAGPHIGGPVIVELPQAVTGEKFEQLKKDFPEFADACLGIFPEPKEQ